MLYRAGACMKKASTFGRKGFMSRVLAGFTVIGLRKRGRSGPAFVFFTEIRGFAGISAKKEV